MANSTRKPYDGPIFDVQARAIKPRSYDAITSGVRTNTGLLQNTIDVIVNNVCKKLAGDLQGED